MQQYDLTALRAFVSVVEAGSFNRAADQLDASAAAVSRRVSGLENALGVKLLNRTTRQIDLTEAGKAAVWQDFSRRLFVRTGAEGGDLDPNLHAPAIRRESDARERGPFVLPDFPPGLDVPEEGGPALASGDHVPAVGRERGGLELARVPPLSREDGPRGRLGLAVPP